MQAWSRDNIIEGRFRLVEPVPGSAAESLWRAQQPEAAANASPEAPVWRWVMPLDPHEHRTAALKATLHQQLERPTVRSERVAPVVHVGERCAAFDAGAGEPLSAWLASGRLDELSLPQRHAVVLALFEGLHDLHGAGEVHGALTPAEVALELATTETPEWASEAPSTNDATAPAAVHLRLVRAGLYGRGDLAHQALAPVALPYADPLQPRSEHGDAEPTARADLFAAGVIAWRVLSLRPLAYGIRLPGWLERCVGPWQERFHDAVAALTAVRAGLQETVPGSLEGAATLSTGGATAAPLPEDAAQAPRQEPGSSSGDASAPKVNAVAEEEAPSFAVVLTKQQPLAVAEISPLLVETLGMHRIDANRRVRRQQGILVRSVRASEANRLVERLKEHQIEAEPVGDAFLEPVPKARAAFYVDGYEEGLLVTKEGEEPIPWQRLDWVSAALIPRVEAIPLTGRSNSGSGEGKASATEIPLDMRGLNAEERTALEATMKRRKAEAAAETVAPGGNPLAEFPRWLEIVAKDEFDVYEKELPDAYLDLALREPATRYRVRARELLPASLGTERSPNWLRNLWLLAHRLAEFMPQDASTPSFESFLARRPDAVLRVDLLGEFDESQVWFAYYKRKRELETLLAE